MLSLLCSGLRLSKKQALIARLFFFSSVVHLAIFALILLSNRGNSLLMINLRSAPVQAFDFLIEEKPTPSSNMKHKAAIGFTKQQTVEKKTVASKKRTPPIKKAASISKKQQPKKRVEKKKTPPPKKSEPIKKEVPENKKIDKEPSEKKESKYKSNEVVKAPAGALSKIESPVVAPQQMALESQPVMPVAQMTPLEQEIETIKNHLLSSWKRPAYIPPTTTCTIEIELTLTGIKTVQLLEPSASYALNATALHFANEYQFPVSFWGKKLRIIF